MRALHPCVLALLRTSCAGWEISILQKACLFVASMGSNMVGILFQKIVYYTCRNISNIDSSAVQVFWTASETAVWHGLCNYYNYKWKQNVKLVSYSCWASPIRFVFSSFSSEWEKKLWSKKVLAPCQSEGGSMGGWSQRSLEPVDRVFKLQPINWAQPMALASGADPLVWQSSAASLLLSASWGSRLLDHRSSASCIQEQRIGEAAVELQMHGFSSGKPETIMWASQLAQYIQQNGMGKCVMQTVWWKTLKHKL